MTKGRLQELWEGFKKGGKMPKIDTEVREGADNVELNVPYEIVNVEHVTTDAQQFAGVRVQLLSAKAKEGSLMLWHRPITGKTSKLGAFITLLGDNTDTWLHNWIVVKSLQRGNNVIELTSAPVAKATKATTAKGVQKAIKKG